jgi:hypothetical protein
MNLDELNDALSANDPDPVEVYFRMDRKRQRRRQRMQAASGSMAVLVILALIVTGLSTLSGSSPSSSSSGVVAAGPESSSAAAAGNKANPNQGSAPKPAATAGDQRNPALVPNPTQQFSGSASAGSLGCAVMPLKAAIADAVHRGASVIVATGTLTGKSVTGNPATAGAPAFYAMALLSVQTLRGPAIAPGSTAWIPGPVSGAGASPVTSTLLAPGGRVFAIVWPKATTHDLVGPTLRLAPVVGGDVVFTPNGCWDLAGLQPSPYQGTTPLRTVPGNVAFIGAKMTAVSGLYAVPLATVEQVTATA